jgi:hypothetical protein
MQPFTEINSEKASWDVYVAQEKARALPLIAKLGFVLDDEQVHVGGERYLMSGRKLVLTASRASDGARSIIKVSSSPEGMHEIEKEHAARIILANLKFAHREFLIPPEFAYVKQDGYLISVTEFVEQKIPFVAHSLEEQFFLSLNAFETQEGIHATTFEHAKIVRDAFGVADAQSYLDSFETFMNAALASSPENDELRATLERAQTFLRTNRVTLERYAGFLTHTDFVPHNLRVVERSIYMLDITSIQFGNKYESWARFLNYMVLHNHELESMLAAYIRKNRGEEEYLALRLMRAYKLGFLISFYAGTLLKTTGDLHTLNQTRLRLWTRILSYILDDEPVPETMITEYQTLRSQLRSEEEKRRQKEIQQLA